MGHRASEESATAPGEEATGREPSRWYRSPAVVATLVVDVLVLIVVAAGTTTLFRGALPDGLLTALDTGNAFDVAVPWQVYAFGVLGAFGFVFTALIREFDRTPLTVVQYHLRVPAAIPLSTGTYLLADLILGGAESTPALVAGLAFVSGLYVNLAYERLAALAERLLPEREDASTGG
ncbi:hypothetical protein [Halorarius halobius]|uniref:hypothetical protein n=1 Tax=Halorarius halobius TaxID=2962671 RepID=UPI0020CE165D|nr:hypothetical protein [Halorarius halobius]